MRNLDIGPGNSRIQGFETLNAVKTPSTDHVGRAEKPPFPDNSFDIVHSSHCIEHVEWFDVEKALEEWIRILKPGGRLEVWTVDGYKIAKALVEYEETGVWPGPDPSWKENFVRRDPYKWVSGRIMAYPKGKNEGRNLWLHRAIMTPRYLERVFGELGLVNIRRMDRSEVRGKDHGWINLGVCGEKLGR